MLAVGRVTSQADWALRPAAATNNRQNKPLSECNGNQPCLLLRPNGCRVAVHFALRYSPMSRFMNISNLPRPSYSTA
jgi:hypothetical protein